MTEIVIDDVSMINRALIRIGAQPIFALDEDTELAEVATSVYFDRVDSIIGTFRFSWARKTYSLNRLDLVPDNGWKYAYAVPGTALNPTPIKLLTDPRDPDRPLRQFLVEAGEIYADENPLWGTFIVRPPPTIWPAVFREAIVMTCAAAFCVPVTHDKDLAQQLAVIAQGTAQEQGRGGLMGQALQVDAAGGQTSAPMGASDPLTSAWKS